MHDAFLHAANTTAQPALSRQQLTANIKAAALALGFSKVGVFSMPKGEIEAGYLESDYLAQWLAEGYHADMAWMKQHFEVRINPQQVMPGTRSIVCVLMNYYTGDHPDDSADGVKISRYAWGGEYHKVIRKRLKQLLGHIQQWAPGVEGRPATDSAPIQERPLAVRTGLGWVGKNGMLINREVGSYTFVGELLLNIPLEPDEPHWSNHCGTCNRCITACPTGAIVEPSVIDANKCLSYWTIENTAERFPDAIRENMQGWVFGCDICQEVCPWNAKSALPTQDPAFAPREWVTHATSQSLLALDEARFDELTQGSPLRRTGLSGLQRNVREHLAGVESSSSGASRPPVV